MRRSLILLSVIGTAFALASCSKSSPQGPTRQQQPAQGPAWTVMMNTKCADRADENCVGAYGFGVTADGKFVAGPGPNGETVSGKLKAAEFASLTGPLTKALEAPQIDGINALKCESARYLYNPTTIRLTRLGDVESPVVEIKETEMCHRMASIEEAEAIQDALMQLALRYYLVPFPGACSQAVGEYVGMFDGIEQCSTDVDCGYFTPDFEPVPERFRVDTDDCTVVNPVAVANVKSVMDKLPTLKAGKNKAVDACGAFGLIRYSCRQFESFYNTAPPVCEQGVCKINPALRTSLSVR